MARPGEWVVLELTPRSEGEDPSLIIKAIRRSLRSTSVEVFVPAIVTEIGDDRKVHWLAEGYAFVKIGLKDSAYMGLEGSRFVQTVLTANSRLSLVSTADIERMRSQLSVEVHQGIGVGDRVMITTGPYRSVEASVIEEFPEIGQVQVHVKLRSKETLIMIPRSGLTILERAPLSPLYSRFMALKTWERRARPVLTWHNTFAPVGAAFGYYEVLEKWSIEGRNLYSFVSFFYKNMAPRLTEMNGQGDELVQLEVWGERFNHLWAFVASYYGYTSKRQAPIDAQLAKVNWLEGTIERIRKLQREVEAIGHAGAKRRKPGGKRVIQNLLVDGFNLVFRSFHAPGLKELKDTQGRPTGMVLGFLNSLGSLRKRFPEARIYVAWDGTSSRRKKAYPDYKANRVSSSAGLIDFDTAFQVPADEGVYHPLVYLMRTLPLFGVWQCWNPDEEADDVIGSMVQGELSGQHNLIYSSDRDFLQLVSETTSMLAPGAGSRKEIMYDVGAVEKSFGVLPEIMVQLRAFYGDKSDNLPGVGRVPKKILRSLVQAHGSVDGVFSSGLTGLSKAQYERLRSAEPQVRINVKLMRLLDVPVSHQDPDPDADAAAQRLLGLDINPAKIVGAFFRHKETADA